MKHRQIRKVYEISEYKLQIFEFPLYFKMLCLYVITAFLIVVKSIRINDLKTTNTFCHFGIYQSILLGIHKEFTFFLICL